MTTKRYTIHDQAGSMRDHADTMPGALWYAEQLDRERPGSYIVDTTTNMVFIPVEIETGKCDACGDDLAWVTGHPERVMCSNCGQYICDECWERH